MMILKSLLRASAALAGLAASSAIGQRWATDSLAKRQDGGNLVFCHFMVSIVNPVRQWGKI